MRITLEGGASLGLMLLVAVAAIALASFFYYRAFGMLKQRQWFLLLGLRVAAILLLILLLFRPVFSFQLNRQERPAVVFLLDTSASMSVADGAGGATRLDQAKAQIERWNDRLKDDFAIYFVEFSERAAPIESIAQLMNTCSPTGKSTSITTGLTAASQRVPKKEMQAVILLSDGIHNSAKDPKAAAAKLGVVVHTVGVGASMRSNRRFVDIQLVGIDCPDRLMVNNKAKIAGSVDAIGLGGQTIDLALDEDGKQIQNAKLTLDDKPGAQKVEFEFRPTVKGRHTYTVRAIQRPEEKIAENNQRSSVAMVVEPGLRVLYIEGTTRMEYKGISSWFLAKDPDIEFVAMFQNKQNKFQRRGNMQGMDLTGIPADEETINKFDVFILGDLDSSYLKTQQDMIVKRVKDGAGLVMLGGYKSLGPGGYAGTPIGESLPVELGTREVGQITDPFTPKLTPDGLRHPIFANIGDFFPTTTGEAKQAGLPDLDGCTRVVRAKPGATVLAIHAGEGDMPVLAVQPVGNGRTAVFCGDTTWKWQQVPVAMGQETPFLRYWGQMIRYLAGRSSAVEAKASVTSSTDKAFFDPEEPMKITAVVRDERGEGAAGAKVIAKVTDPNQRTFDVPLSAVTGPGGHFEGSFQPKQAATGNFQIVVEAEIAAQQGAGKTTIAGEKMIVEVGRVNLEFEKLDMDEDTLMKIAAASGGRYVHINRADNLIEQLDKTQQEKVDRIEKALFWPPGFWLLFVAVLSAEWILRKRFQLR